MIPFHSLDTPIDFAPFTPSGLDRKLQRSEFRYPLTSPRYAAGHPVFAAELSALLTLYKHGIEPEFVRSILASFELSGLTIMMDAMPPVPEGFVYAYSTCSLLEARYIELPWGVERALRVVSLAYQKP